MDAVGKAVLENFSHTRECVGSNYETLVHSRSRTPMLPILQQHLIERLHTLEGMTGKFLKMLPKKRLEKPEDTRIWQLNVLLIALGRGFYGARR